MTEQMPRWRFMELPMDARREILRLQAELLQVRTEAESTREAIHKREQEALAVARNYGMTDGSHHKMWVIDQMVRILTGEEYKSWVADTEDGEDGAKTYEWECGIAP